MTEQPEQIEEAQPTGTVSAPTPEGAPAQTVPPQGVPAPEPEWRFFVRLQDNPDVANYLQPQSLHRLQETETDLFTHRFERETRTWVHNPGMIAFTGIGGSDDFQEIDEDEANALISQWTQETTEEETETEETEVGEEEEEEGEL